MSPCTSLSFSVFIPKAAQLLCCRAGGKSEMRTQRSMSPSGSHASELLVVSWVLPVDGPLVAFCSGELRAGIPGLALGKLTPGAIESGAFVLSQEKGDDVFKLRVGCWALGQRGDKPQG